MKPSAPRLDLVSSWLVAATVVAGLVLVPSFLGREQAASRPPASEAHLGASTLRGAGGIEGEWSLPFAYDADDDVSAGQGYGFPAAGDPGT